MALDKFLDLSVPQFSSGRQLGKLFLGIGVSASLPPLPAGGHPVPHTAFGPGWPAWVWAPRGPQQRLWSWPGSRTLIPDESRRQAAEDDELVLKLLPPVMGSEGRANGSERVQPGLAQSSGILESSQLWGSGGPELDPGPALPIATLTSRDVRLRCQRRGAQITSWGMRRRDGRPLDSVVCGLYILRGTCTLSLSHLRHVGLLGHFQMGRPRLER